MDGDNWYHEESVLVHEFAHSVMDIGLNRHPLHVSEQYGVGREGGREGARQRGESYIYTLLEPCSNLDVVYIAMQGTAFSVSLSGRFLVPEQPLPWHGFLPNTLVTWAGTGLYGYGQVVPSGGALSSGQLAVSDTCSRCDNASEVTVCRRMPSSRPTRRPRPGGCTTTRTLISWLTRLSIGLRRHRPGLMPLLGQVKRTQ